MARQQNAVRIDRRELTAVLGESRVLLARVKQKLSVAEGGGQDVSDVELPELPEKLATEVTKGTTVVLKPTAGLLSYFAELRAVGRELDTLLAQREA
jgi:hypothetical protein